MATLINAIDPIRLTIACATLMNAIATSAPISLINPIQVKSQPKVVKFDKKCVKVKALFSKLVMSLSHMIFNYYKC